MDKTRELYADLGNNNRFVLDKGDLSSGIMNLYYSDRGTFVILPLDTVSVVLTPKSALDTPLPVVFSQTGYNQLSYTVGPVNNTGSYYMDVIIHRATGERIVANDSSVIEFHIK